MWLEWYTSTVNELIESSSSRDDDMYPSNHDLIILLAVETVERKGNCQSIITLHQCASRTMLIYCFRMKILLPWYNHPSTTPHSLLVCQDLQTRHSVTVWPSYPNRVDQMVMVSHGLDHQGRARNRVWFQLFTLAIVSLVLSLSHSSYTLPSNLLDDARFLLE